MGDECVGVVGALRDPFAAHFVFRGSTLVALASRHTTDPQSSTIALLRRTFASTEPALVLVEGLATDAGSSPKGFAPQRGTDAFRGGESRYAAKLANEAGQPFLGIEPRDQDINTDVLKSYKSEDIVGAFVLRAIRSRGLMLGQPPLELENYAQRTAERYMRGDTRLSNAFENFSGWYQMAYGRSPWADPKLRSRGSPCSQGLAGSVLKQITLLRNEHIALLIASVFPVTAKILLVFGSGHYRALAPLLEKRYGAPRYETV